MAVLPEEIPTGTIVGQFYFVNEDNIDADTAPELTVVSGKVSFVCEATEPLRMPTKKAIIIPMEFDAEFDSQGRLVPAGRTELGIELPASNSPLFNPTDFTWKVTFDLIDVATQYTIQIPSFSIVVPEGVVSDIVDLMPVSVAPGTIMVQGPQGEPGVMTSMSDADVASLINTTGTQTEGALSATYMAVRSTAPDPAVIPAYIDVSVVPPTIKVWDGAGWIIASGGNGEPAPPPAAMRQLLSSAQQAHGTWAWSGSQTNGYGSWTRHVLEAAVTDPVLFWRVRSTSTNTVGVTMRAAWRRVGQTAWNNLTFGGATSRVLIPTDDFSADPIIGVFAENDAIEVLVHLTGDLGSTANPPATGNQTATDGSEGCYVMTWATLAGGAAPTNTSNLWPTLRPTGIVANVSLNSWALAGTSIGAASKSLLDRAAANLGIAATNFAKGAEGFNNFPASFTTRYGTLLPNFNRAIVEHGANDTQSVVATIKSNAIAYWNSLANAGIEKIVQTTTTPFTTSTDGWTTTANQTPVPEREPNRLALNQWLRDGAPIISGIGAATGTTDPTAKRIGQTGHPLALLVDICAVVESAQDSGKWRVDLGAIAGDGLHPNATAHHLMGQKLADDITAAGLNT